MPQSCARARALTVTPTTQLTGDGFESGCGLNSGVDRDERVLAAVHVFEVKAQSVGCLADRDRVHLNGGEGVGRWCERGEEEGESTAAALSDPVGLAPPPTHTPTPTPTLTFLSNSTPPSAVLLGGVSP